MAGRRQAGPAALGRAVGGGCGRRASESKFLSVPFIVGAHALAWHGLPRYTKDIDFLVRADAGNADALLRV